MNSRKGFYFLIFLVCTHNIFGQELNCSVQVSTQQVQSDKTIFDNMQKALYEFVNNTKWTNDIYSNEERIDCSILINVSERIGSDEFKATIQVQSRRPVFKTSYTTNILNYSDNDVKFKYLQFDQLSFNDNSYQSELTSLMAFYAYMILGYDYDSFQLNGGTPYFQKALAVVNAAQNSGSPGWKAFEGTRNRYWLVNNHLDQAFKPLRSCLYEYHRLGLDVMSEKTEEGRIKVSQSLEQLNSIHSIRPLSYNMQIFFLAKNDELVKMFTPAATDQKTKIVNLLKKLDPGNTAKYQKILTATN